MDPDAPPLLAALTGVRRHVLGILDGLDDDQLTSPVLPSGWSCVGLLHHLAVGVERFWFRAVVDAQESAWATYGPDAGDPWTTDLPADQVVALYQRECDLADEVLARTSLDTAPARWPDDLFGDFRMADLRTVVLHVLVETATHAGHLDAAREVLDGRQWMVL